MLIYILYICPKCPRHYRSLSKVWDCPRLSCPRTCPVQIPTLPKEADLDENEALVGSYVMKLNDKYVCDIQNHKHCFIKEDRYLSLNNFAISL